MAPWVEHTLALILVAFCAGLIVRSMLRSAAGRRRGGCGGCAKCEPTPETKPVAKPAVEPNRRVVFLPAGHLGRKR